MSLTISAADLRAVARTTYDWVDQLGFTVAHHGQWADDAARTERVLARACTEAVGISWGTPEATSLQVPRLIGAINDVAIHSGVVDAATGAAKPRDLRAAYQAARHAHGEVQTVLMQHGWHPTGSYYFPR
ncbi:MAG: hypothetical protein KDC46_15545 [Thermoleophilia bacterium]|nr:hypothetical protein [Thermoleophilia bacterium]